MKREYEKRKENENENEEYYILLLVLFDENFALALELFCAAAGVERSGSRLACRLACDSSVVVIHFTGGGHSLHCPLVVVIDSMSISIVVVVHQFSVLRSRKICENERRR